MPYIRYYFYSLIIMNIHESIINIIINCMIMSSIDARGVRSWRAQDKNLWKISKGCEEKNSKICFGNISSWPGMTLIVTFPRMNNHEWSWIHILSIDKVQLWIIWYIQYFILINTFRRSILKKHNQTDTRPVPTLCYLWSS